MAATFHQTDHSSVRLFEPFSLMARVRWPHLTFCSQVAKDSAKPRRVRQQLKFYFRHLSFDPSFVESRSAPACKTFCFSLSNPVQAHEKKRRGVMLWYRLRNRHPLDANLSSFTQGPSWKDHFLMSIEKVSFLPKSLLISCVLVQWPGSPDSLWCSNLSHIVWVACLH